MNKERLLKLADHLESGELGHQVFDISEFNNARGPYCGTAGCAIGECPIVWPDYWEFSSLGYPKLKRKFTIKHSIMEWFNIDPLQVHHLFQAEAQQTDIYGGIVLGTNATAAQVAANIRAFVNQKPA